MAEEANGRGERIEVIFHAAAALTPPERSAYLDRACGEDHALRKEVEALLNADDNAGQFMAAPTLDTTLDAAPSAAPETVPPAEPPRLGVGSVIDRYELMEVLGKGGFGTVYRAKQLAGVRREVALKVLNPGMNSQQVLARFETERQALAVMNHPNVAKVFDAGQTATGYPYFVMELVRGIAITRYCDSERLDTRHRLELFVQACQAAQHAHQKGVIHRDLKPGNILVAAYDGVPVVKVIDFGIAKAVGEPLTAQSPDTAFGAILGSLQYMSPEQATFNALDIDTRSDIYALGAVLYELLTGAPPLKERLSGRAALDSLLTVIRDVEPATPSNRLSASGEALPSIAAFRNVEPARLGKLVRGELDWIVMKALAKERSRRYESASSLASDVSHYLAGEKVEAGPASMRYRARKFLRRYRGPVLAASLLLLCLIGGVVGTSWGLVREARQRRAAEASGVAERAARLAEQAARIESDHRREEATRQQKIAEAAAARARAFSQVLRSSLAMSDPSQLSATPVSFADMADEAADELDRRPDMPPEVRGPVYSFLAQALATRKDVGPALRYGRKGLELSRQSLPPDSPEVLQAHEALATVELMGRDVPAARRELDEIGKLLAGRDDLTDERLEFVKSRVLLCLAEHDYPAAERDAKELVKLVEQGYGAAPSRMLIRARFFCLFAEVAQLGGGPRLAEAAIEAKSVADDAEHLLGPDQGLALMCRITQVALLAVSGATKQAEPMLVALLPRAERVFGKDHYVVGETCALLGFVYKAQARDAEAAPLLERATKIADDWSKTPHFGMEEALGSTAAIAGDRKMMEAAIQKLNAATASTRPATPAFNSGRLLAAIFRLPPLLKANDSAGIVKLLEPALGEPPPQRELTRTEKGAVAMARLALWSAYTQVGRGKLADEQSKKWLDETRPDAERDVQSFCFVVMARWSVLFSADRNADGLAMVDAELTSRPAIRDRADIRPLYAYMRGVSLVSLKRYDEAAPLLEEALAGIGANPVSMTFMPGGLDTAAQALVLIYHVRGDEAAADRIAAKFHLDKKKLIDQYGDEFRRPSTAPAAQPASPRPGPPGQRPGDGSTPYATVRLKKFDRGSRG